MTITKRDLLVEELKKAQKDLIARQEKDGGVVSVELKNLPGCELIYRLDKGFRVFRVHNGMPQTIPLDEFVIGLLGMETEN